MISKNIEVLCSNIISVYNDVLKYYGEFKPIIYKHKYSSSPNGNIRLLHKDDVLPLKGFKVQYSCPNCSNISEVLLKRFLEKETIKCRKCFEDFEKRRKQSEYVKNSMNEFGKIVKKERKSDILKFSELLYNELISLSNEHFYLESDDFRTEYFKKVPTIEDFKKIEHKIKLNGKDMSEFKYYPYIRTNHSHRYSPKLLDDKGKFHLLSNLTFKCDSCNKYFDGRKIKQRSIEHKILCKDCGLCNKTFKIRKIKNIKGNEIMYQSGQELDLIEYCNINSILIENGPNIEYFFNKKILKYRVDFKIKNILIEIKDNHIWHKREVDLGKWYAKETAAKRYCSDNNMEYKLVMKYDIKNLKDHILRYQWI